MCKDFLLQRLAIMSHFSSLLFRNRKVASIALVSAALGLSSVAQAQLGEATGSADPGRVAAH
jgi:hypothetical protein